MKVLSAVAWPYANGPRHLGHVAGFGVPSDVFSRYMRMAGHDVLMVSGSDEHGTPILVLADQAEVTPREFVDTNHAVIAGELTDLGCSYDLYTRTTTANHYAVAQELFTQVWTNGYMVEQTTQGAISPSTGRTLPDRYIEGTCPICGYGEARGDQCDNCGNQLDPTDLIDPRSRINGETPEFVETQHFLLDLPALADALRGLARGARGVGHVAAQRHQVQPQHPRRHPSAGDDPRHRLGHPGAARRLARQPRPSGSTCGSTPSSATSRPRSSGPDAPATPSAGASGGTTPRRVSHYFMGKDNITFHSQIWPAELLGYAGKGSRGGEPGVYGELNLPTEVVSSEYLTMEGRQFSTSRGYTILVRDVLERYGPDGIRYFICAAGPGEPGRQLHLARVRAAQQLRARRRLGQPRLAHGGDGREELRRDPGSRARSSRSTRRCAPRCSPGSAAVGGLLERHRQKAAIAEAMRVVGEVNAYVSRTEPFKLKGDDQRERLATVLHTLVQCVSDLNTMLAPFLPHAANRVRRGARRRRRVRARCRASRR